MALQMGGHLQQSLAKSHKNGDHNVIKSLLRYLKETLEFLSHDHHGLQLASDLHANTTATIGLMGAPIKSQLQDSLWEEELRELTRKLEIITAGKMASKVRKRSYYHVEIEVQRRK